MMDKISRRVFLSALGVAGTVVAATGGKRTVRIVEFDALGQRKGVVEVEKIVKTDADWKEQLTPEQYQVARKAGTERAFTGKYADRKRRRVGKECRSRW